MKKSQIITMDEWLKELRNKPSVNVEGFTATELADRLGCCKDSAREQIRNGIKKGDIEFVGKKHYTRIDGGIALKPVYKVTRKR